MTRNIAIGPEEVWRTQPLPGFAAIIQRSPAEKKKAAVTLVTELTIVNPPLLPMLKWELSCIVKPIDNKKEFAFLSTYRSTTILNSGTTFYLIKDRGYFIDIENEDRPPVKTTSQGDLLTTGRGTCVMEMRLGELTHHVMLKECLHTPGTMLNLLSVRCMLQKGWDCNFKGVTATTGSHCTLSYQGEWLEDIPALENLFYIQVHFLHTAELTNETTIYKCLHGDSSNLGSLAYTYGSPWQRSHQILTTNGNQHFGWLS